MADRGIGARYSVEETSELSALCSSHFTPEERTPCTLSKGRCVSSWAGVGSLKEWEIFCTHQQSNRSHPIVHPVAESTVTELQYLGPQSVSTQICKGSVPKKDNLPRTKVYKTSGGNKVNIADGNSLSVSVNICTNVRPYRKLCRSHQLCNQQVRCTGSLATNTCGHQSHSSGLGIRTIEVNLHVTGWLFYRYLRAEVEVLTLVCIKWK